MTGTDTAPAQDAAAEVTEEPTTEVLHDGEDFSNLSYEDPGAYSSAGDYARTGTTLAGGAAAGAIGYKNKDQYGDFLRDTNQNNRGNVDKFFDDQDASKNRMKDAVNPSSPTSSDMSKGERNTVRDINKEHQPNAGRDAENAARDTKKNKLDSGSSERRANREASKSASKSLNKSYNTALSKSSKEMAEKVGKRSTLEAGKKAGLGIAKRVGARAGLMLLGPAGVGLGVGLLAFEVFTGPLGKAIGGLFNSSGPSTDTPPSGGNSWLPMTDPDEQE